MGVGSTSTELAHTVAAASCTVNDTVPHASAPSGANPPEVRGVSIVNVPRTRSSAKAAFGARANGAFVEACVSASGRTMVPGRTFVASTEVDTCRSQAASLQLGASASARPPVLRNASSVTR